MTVAAKEDCDKKISRKQDDRRKLQCNKKHKLKPQLISKGKDKGVKGLKKKIVDKAISQKNKTHKKNPSLGGLKGKSTKASTPVETSADKDAEPHNTKKKRSRKKIKNDSEIDEASRLQKRTRYLLVKMKLEQNFIDAYSAEGWKGQSREKIKPAQELQRARKQILKCKLGIREAIRQLDELSSVGRINDSAVDPDGSVHHEHIICAKCKSQEVHRDNDIILCDGTCNCAYHQKCLDPPLLTEDIPPKDEGWLCKFCTKKMEILEATNAHLGTQFPVDSTWQDVFKEEADLPDDENSTLITEEWPSDDSEDDDYDPVESGYSDGATCSGSEASNCSSSFLGSLEDEPLLGIGSGSSSNNSLQMNGVDSDEFNAEVLSHPRQRASVDYIKLYDEMFGNSFLEFEQITDDEDWGPNTKRQRKVKGTDAPSVPMTTDETDIISQQEIDETARNVSEETSLDTKEKTVSRSTKSRRKVKGTDEPSVPRTTDETARSVSEETSLDPKEKPVSRSTKKRRKVKETDEPTVPRTTDETARSVSEETSLDPKEKPLSRRSTKNRRKVKGTDEPSVPRTTDETETISQQEVDDNAINVSEKTSLEPKDRTPSRRIKRSIFRLPHCAVQRLRSVFAENELPARSLRKSLSEELGLDFGKVNKWFKNSRYLALKARKARGDMSRDVGVSGQKESASETENDEHADEIPLADTKTSEPNKGFNMYVRRRNTNLLPVSSNKRQKKKPLVQLPGVIKTSVDPGDDVSLKHLKDRAKAAKKKLNRKNRRGTSDAEAEMERLCKIKNRVERIREALRQLPSSKNGKSKVDEPYTIYVPVAELKEKW